MVEEIGKNAGADRHFPVLVLKDGQYAVSRLEDVGMDNGGGEGGWRENHPSKTGFIRGGAQALP